MVETTIEIRFGDGSASARVDSNIAGEAERQAELVSLGHYAARVFVLLGPERSATLVTALAGLDDQKSKHVMRPDSGAVPAGRIVVLARFLDTRRGPRSFFRVKQHGDGAVELSDSVLVLVRSLLRKRAADDGYARSLMETTDLVGRVARGGGLAKGNEFDVALAAADVAWRGALKQAPVGQPAWNTPTCPACGNADRFELRLWPSDRSGIRKCAGCGSGIWLRERRARLFPADVWQAMEGMRAELDGAEQPAPPPAAFGGDGNEAVLLAELKRVFVENRWPFSEVQGAPVLLSELSGTRGSWKFYAQVVEEQAVILLYSVCPERVPVERRLEASSFLTRANYGLAAGNFELDFDDGEIRYKTVLQLQGDRLDAATLKRLVRANGIAMETYLPGIGAVITGTPAVPVLERRPIA
jgi:hypothetical protein